METQINAWPVYYKLISEEDTHLRLSMGDDSKLTALNDQAMQTKTGKESKRKQCQQFDETIQQITPACIIGKRTILKET